MDELPGLAFSIEAAMDRDGEDQSFRGRTGSGRGRIDLRGIREEAREAIDRKALHPLARYCEYMRDNLERARAYTRIPSLYE